MSVRDTIILTPKELRYLLIDSLRLYSDNVAFIDGNNPYRFSINKKTFYVLIKNVHESGENRDNPDECRIQVAKSRNFNEALSSNKDVIVLGYFADEKVFTAWNPHMMRDRFNQKSTVSLYSRFSVQKMVAEKKIATYRDANKQSIISFSPTYLGLYLENLESIHLISDIELQKLVNKSDLLDFENSDGQYDTAEHTFEITHTRPKRDSQFAIKVNDAYDNRCAMCGIQLGLTEAAHIVPFAHEKSSEDIDNGISLCTLHHRAYDRALIYFDKDFDIHINEIKMKYYEKSGFDSGARKFETLAFDKLIVPKNHALKPNLHNIEMANQIRGIFI